LTAKAGRFTLEWFHYGSKGYVVPTLTLKNIPDDLHARLRESADRNRRSLNSEILMRLESDFAAPAVEPEVHARTLKAFVARLPKVEHAMVNRYKRQGRA
jgi:plasmid stability protein